jgi:hypothetical protein
MNFLESFAFEITYLFHILVWLVVLCGFMNRNLAFFNIKYLIPTIYLLHILPIHFLENIKTVLAKNKEAKEKYQSIINKRYIFPDLFTKLQQFFSFSFINPLSVQGMMLFGMITSSYSLSTLR